MQPGQRKIAALRISLSVLMGLAGLYVFCLVMGYKADATVFSAFAASVGAVTASFNWANGQEHR